jgi:hypothetical protein
MKFHSRCESFAGKSCENVEEATRKNEQLRSEFSSCSEEILAPTKANKNRSNEVHYEQQRRLSEAAFDAELAITHSRAHYNGNNESS